MTESKKYVSELKEDMIISRDVISEEGIFLIPADTKINKNHILKIQLYQISTVFVYDEEEPSVSTPSRQSKEPLVAQTPEFKSFLSKYMTQVNKLEKEFTKMVTSGEIDHSTLSDYVTEMVQMSSKSSLFTYLCRIQNEDHDTFSHCLNVSILAKIFAHWLGLDAQEQVDLSIAGLLHDIGKTQIDLNLLNKKEPLTVDEFEIIKTHTTLGYKLVENSNVDMGIKQAVLLHHERMNGSGYPLAPSWDTIHRYAKIIAIVDVYDAITSDRAYRKRVHPFTAIRILEEDCYGLLDTHYLYVFLENIAYNFLNNDVLLTNGEEGKIIFINPQSPSRPIVQTATHFLDLMTEVHISIERFI